MKISPLYEVLIYLEDKGFATDAELKNFGDTISRGVIGKMESMRLIERVTTGLGTTYKLSKNGYEFLNVILDQIHQRVEHWDNKWRLVWFSIPEKNRSQRDKLRRFLINLGLKPILNSLWVSPLDISNLLKKYLNKNNLLSEVLFAETEYIYGISIAQILKSWNFDESRNLYEQFILEAEQFLKKSEKKSFEIKKLIFWYANIINSEPRLPIELMPNDWPRFRANLYYKRIKRFLG